MRHCGACHADIDEGSIHMCTPLTKSRTAEVLDKVINKPPFLCRLGWHRWQVIQLLPGTVYWHVVLRCRRCPAEHTKGIK